MVFVRSERASACCPLCSQVSDAVHSRYQCTLRDAPCGGQALRLRLTVHKFFCKNPGCSRRIFTERLRLGRGYSFEVLRTRLLYGIGQHPNRKPKKEKVEEPPVDAASLGVPISTLVEQG